MGQTEPHARGCRLGSAVIIDADAQHSLELPWIAASLIAGAAAFVLGSRLIEMRGGKRRKNPVGEGDDNPLGIVLGSALDGIPESFVLGLSVLTGGVSFPLLVGIGLSNLPEGMAASAGLRARRWPMARVMLMWSAVVATSAFAAGALLAMISDTVIPESYAIERVWTGGLVVGGFAGSLVLASVLR